MVEVPGIAPGDGEEARVLVLAHPGAGFPLLPGRLDPLGGGHQQQLLGDEKAEILADGDQLAGAGHAGQVVFLGEVGEVGGDVRPANRGSAGDGDVVLAQIGEELHEVGRVGPEGRATAISPDEGGHELREAGLKGYVRFVLHGSTVASGRVGLNALGLQESGSDNVLFSILYGTTTDRVKGENRAGGCHFDRYMAIFFQGICRTGAETPSFW